MKLMRIQRNYYEFFAGRMRPVVYALMTRRYTVMYMTLFEALRDMFNFNPTTIMADFECASMRAAKAIWPQARFKGCNFHHLQAIRRKSIEIQVLREELKVNQRARFGLKLIMRLSMLPRDNLQAGVDFVQEYINRHDLADVFMEFWE